MNEDSDVKRPRDWQAYFDKIPLGRAGLPNDYTGMAVLLASEELKWMTGQVLAIDGGHTLAF